MHAPERLKQLIALYRLGIAAARLPVLELCFHSHIDPQHIAAAYRHYARRHPRYSIIGNKTVGMALVDFSRYAGPGTYAEAVSQRDGAGPQSRRARSRGYALREINRNDHLDAIHAIDRWEEAHQRRRPDDSYIARTLQDGAPPYLACYGAFDSDGQLVAYCNVGYFGNFAVTDQLMSRKNGDGVLFLLLFDLISELIATRRVDYLMYDTYFGAQPELREFKRRVGFAPYRVRYTLT